MSRYQKVGCVQFYLVAWFPMCGNIMCNYSLWPLLGAVAEDLRVLADS